MRLDPYGAVHQRRRTRLFDVCVELGGLSRAAPAPSYAAGLA
jgi:hypothetical protein